MSAEGSHQSGDPLAGARLAFEEHERKLLDELLERLWRGIPPGATVGEAKREMEKAAVEDEGVWDLLLRVKVLERANRGYLRAHFAEAQESACSAEPRYRSTLVRGAGAKEAQELLENLRKELEGRLPSGLSEAEREKRIAELIGEDARLREMALRLDHLFGHDPEAPGEP